jgi:transcriptional regulator with XRE-family HTH domain
MAKRRKQIQPRSGVERAFGQVIRQIRKELEISQAELEKRTGLDRTFISDLERGIQGPGIRTLFRIAKGLETPAWDLIHLTAKSSLFAFPRGRDTA